MRADEFLKHLEQRQLLPAKQVASLREQMAAKAQPWPAEKLAKLLVDNGRLTAEQAQAVLTAPEEDDDLLSLEEDDELSLAALDDDVKSKPTSPASKSAASQSQSASTKTAAKSKAAAKPAADADSLLAEELGLGGGGGLDPLDSLLSDSLGGLSDPLGAMNDPLGSMSGPLAAGGAMEAKPQKAAKAKRDKSRSQWDTPLILVGGGVLVSLLLIGGGALFWLNRGGGDEQLKIAEDFYKSGSYTQAIHNYNEFLTSYDTHPSASLARVHRGMARMRQATDGARDFSAALVKTKEVLAEIENEPSFPEARDELRAMLPAIAEGLAKQAQAAEDPAQIGPTIEQAQEALVLIANTKYVPKSVRPVQRIEQIEGILNVVARDQKRDSELQGTLAAMEKLGGEGDTEAAYAQRRKLLKTYPDLKDNEALAAATIAVSQAEAGNVRVVETEMPAAAADHPSPLVAELALANRRGEAIAGVTGERVFVQVEGAVYGLDATSGKLLWRRAVGADAGAQPVPLAGQGSKDALAADVMRQELLRLKGDSGELVWRLPVGERINPPTVAADKLFVSTEGGKLLAVDPASGAAPRHAVLPQRLQLAPTVHPRGPTLYQVGHHSNLYVLASDELKCEEVVYLGHEPGTIAVPPVVAGDNVLVAENWGLADATLHVLTADAQGRGLKNTQQIRFAGHVRTPPVVFGRQVVVATDRGEVQVFEISTGSEGNPLIPLIKREAVEGEPLRRYLAILGGRLWIADTQLGQFVIQAAGGRLVPQAMESSERGDVFDAPLQVVGNVIVHTRRRQGAPGHTVAALDPVKGVRHWETDLAVPPAGAPYASIARREIALVSATGAVFKFDAAAIKARVQDQPLASAPPDQKPALLRAAIDLGEGQLVFVPDTGGATCLAFNAEKPSARWFTLSSPLAAAPTAYQNGLLAPTQNGQVQLIDPATGKPQTAPFQPRLEAGQELVWRTPGVDGDKVVVADGKFSLYRLAIKPEPTPHFEAAAQIGDLGQPLTSPVALLADHAYAVDAVGVLQRFALPELKSAGGQDLQSQPIWGPRRVGEQVLLVTETETLVAINSDGQIAWNLPLEHGPLAGPPLVDEASYVLTSRSGQVWRVASATGAASPALNLGQPLATSAVVFGPNLVAAGHDGALLVFKLPAGE